MQGCIGRPDIINGRQTFDILDTVEHRHNEVPRALENTWENVLLGVPFHKIILPGKKNIFLHKINFLQ